MIAQDLTLKNFRNYEDIKLQFSPEINFITGDNGVGKSNILEAISILANLKSFRNIHDSELVRWGETSYFCSLEALKCNGNKFEVGYISDDQRIKKKVKVDETEIKSASDYYGRLKIVVFSPIDIDIIHGAPDLRRRFFDSVISKVNNEYFKTLNEFRRILYARNKLLKRLKENSQNFKELEVWDQLFSEKASIILKERRKFVEGFNGFFNASYSHISDENRSPDLVYKPSLENNDSSYIMNKLKSMRRRDILFGSTGVGPQRDAYRIVNEKMNSFTNYASQGQKRTAAISLKIAESEMIESVSKDQSIILVDDIFSELDLNRRKNMIDFLSKGNQVIFTMVNSETMEITSFSEYKHFIIEPAGRVQEV